MIAKARCSTEQLAGSNVLPRLSNVAMLSHASDAVIVSTTGTVTRTHRRLGLASGLVLVALVDAMKMAIAAAITTVCLKNSTMTIVHLRHCGYFNSK